MRQIFENTNKKASPKTKTQPDQELRIQENTQALQGLKTLLFLWGEF